MQINTNVNTMIKLEKNLDDNASDLSKKSFNRQKKEELKENNVDSNDITTNIIEQNQIALTYSVNGSAISVQNSVQDTILDIKA